MLLIQAGLGWVIWRYVGASWTEKGQFGDMFGVVNALFSGLAFAGVIYAILLQRKELQLQRQELELTRHELERSAEAQELSAGLLQEQLQLAVEEAERQVAPVFQFTRLTGPETEPTFEIVNTGGPAYGIKLLSSTGSGDPEVRLAREHLLSGERLSIHVKGTSDLPSLIVVRIQFEDSRGQFRRAVLQMDRVARVVRVLYPVVGD